VDAKLAIQRMCETTTFKDELGPYIGLDLGYIVVGYTSRVGILRSVPEFRDHRSASTMSRGRVSRSAPFVHWTRTGLKGEG
jgi:hypothetical protein